MYAYAVNHRPCVYLVQPATDIWLLEYRILLGRKVEYLVLERLAFARIGKVLPRAIRLVAVLHA